MENFTKNKYYSVKETVVLKDDEGNSFLVYKKDVMTLEGEYYYRVGRRHTLDSKKRISDKNREYQLKHSKQRGTCWVMNIELKENKKIDSKELDKWLKLGWIKGRKMNWK